MAESVTTVGEFVAEQPTVKLTQTIAERLKGLTGRSSTKIESELYRRRRKWRKRASKSKLLCSGVRVVYKPVDEALLAEKEEVLDQFEEKVEKLVESRKLCSAAAQQLEGEKLRNQLEDLQSDLHNLRNDISSLTSRRSSFTGVADGTGSDSDIQQLLQILSTALEQAKSLQQVKQMKLGMASHRPPLQPLQPLPTPSAGHASLQTNHHPETSQRGLSVTSFTASEGQVKLTELEETVMADNSVFMLPSIGAEEVCITDNEEFEVVSHLTVGEVHIKCSKSAGLPSSNDDSRKLQPDSTTDHPKVMSEEKELSNILSNLQSATENLLQLPTYRFPHQQSDSML